MRVYHENTPKEDANEAGAVAAMRKGAKAKVSALYFKLAKMVAVANPDLGIEWLHEV